MVSVCQSLQCLISTLTQAGGDGLLFRFACSVCCREGGALQRSVTGACSGHAGFAPLTARVLSSSTLLRLPAALYGAGPELRAVPVFGSSSKAQTQLGLRFVPSPTGAAQAAWSLMGALSPVRCAFSPLWSQPQFPHTGRVRLLSLLGSWSLAATLRADVNHPESPEVFG